MPRASEASPPDLDETGPPVAAQAAGRRPRIVLAPMNFADMPMQIVQALRRRGYTAEHAQYSSGQGHKFGYALDKEVDLHAFGSKPAAHGATLRHYLDADFDIFHFWNKSFFFVRDYTTLTGLDLPLLKARQKRIIHRFSGFDLRLRSWDLERNPHSPFRYGYSFVADERLQIGFIEMLRDYADQLLVQDPELGQFLPEARIIPRALDLRQWPFVGVAPADRPLVVHTPSNPEIKGTRFVLAAVEALRAEGLAFDFRLVQDVSHDEARAWMRKADIVVDQLLIGATGVVTLEAWALGKPVVLYLREDLFRPFYGTSELPVANANPDTVTAVLRDLIRDLDWRRHLSAAGRRTVESHHDIDKVIDQLIELYEAVHRSPPRLPAGTADIDYLVLQTEAAIATAKALRKIETRPIIPKKLRRHWNRWVDRLTRRRRPDGDPRALRP
jgi:glycosyltransferase involved in cell wall biosynthesis